MPGNVGCVQSRMLLCPARLSLGGKSRAALAEAGPLEA